MGDMFPAPGRKRVRSYGPSGAHVTDWRHWPHSWAAWRKPLIRWAPGDRRVLVIDGGRFVAYLTLRPWRRP